MELMRRLLVVLGVLVAFIVLVGVGLYYRGGLREYLQVRKAIKALPETEKVEVQEGFYGKVAEVESQNGILAGLTKIGSRRIWLWGRSGLQSLPLDEYTVYSFYSACNAQVLEAIERGGQLKIGREVTANIEKWREQVKTGMFVGIMKAGVDNGGELGNAREVQAYDWWVFMNSNLREQCAK